jgi:hypothetical protein
MASFPEIRITEMAHAPEGEAKATIVSLVIINYINIPTKLQRNKLK